MPTAIGSLLVVLLISLLITRVAAMALRLTGMSQETAAFQARSAFTGVGFTTTEAEDIVSHPVRRRIVMILMLLGNIGVGAVIATIVVSASKQWNLWSFLFLTAGLTGVWLFARSRIVERWLNKIIAWALLKFGNFTARDYIAVLQLDNGYAVSELAVEANDWLANKSLMELKLTAEGILVLGIRQTGGNFIGTPTADTIVRPGDLMTVYGQTVRIAELDQRRKGAKGDVAHEEAVEEHEEALEEQERASSLQADESK